MNILRNAGSHKILAIMHGINGESPLELIELAGRTAYQSRDKITTDSAAIFVKNLIARGHESVLEHSQMTVQFDNCSIGMIRELDRHRLASFTESSTRYVDEKDFSIVMPPNPGQSYANCAYTAAIRESEIAYTKLREKGVPAEDARQILPLGLACQTVMSANFREWRYIFKERTNKRAHWEIRRVLIQLLADCRGKIPVVFDDIGPEFTKTEAEDWGWCVIETRPMSDWIKVAL